MAVQGNLKDMSLPNIVQTICLDQRNASLVLRHQIEEGIIFFAEGEIVHARTATLEGEEAVYYLLSWADGTFHIKDQVTIPRRTVHLPWGHLLMEGLRLLDEQQATNTDLTQAEHTLSPTQLQEDELLEGDLFILLTRLEHMQAQLAHRKNRKRPPLALQVLTDIVNEVVTFSEVWLDTTKYTDSLTRALAKASDIHTSARLLQVHNNKLLIAVISKLYQSWSSDPAGRRQMFRQVGQGMLDILETYFSLLIACFHAPDVAAQCQELCDIFLADLTGAVDKIKF